MKMSTHRPGGGKVLSSSHGVSLAIISLLMAASAAEAKDKVRQDADFHLINYRLPETKLAATLALTLEECGGTPTVSGEFALRGDAAAARNVFTLTPGDLEGARTKRVLNITLHDTGTIATINSNNADRTGSIIGNVIKFAASVAGAFLGVNLPKASFAGGQSSICSEGILAALYRVRRIDDMIVTLRGRPLPEDPLTYRRNSRMIDRLIAERESLRSGLLRVELEEALTLDGLAGTAQVDLMPMAKKWFKGAVPNGQTVSVAWTAVLASGALPRPGEAPAEACETALKDAGKARFICFVEPARVQFAATATATGLTWVGGAPKLEAKKAIPVAQWGTLQRLHLNARFGSARDLALTLDKFGRASEMKWSSEARLENITGSAATIAGQVQGIVAANSDLARQKAEIDELTTQQTLNRLRACRDILSRGGSKCPTDAEVDDAAE